MRSAAGSSEQADRSLLRLFLMLLLAADAAFIGIHIVHLATPWLMDNRYSIEWDGGFAEWFQYVKELWVVILAATLWRRTGNVFFAGWMLLYGYLLCDDSFSIHEIAGDIAYRHLGFGPAFGLRATDIGELFINCLMGLGFLVLIGSGYRKADANARDISRDLTMLFVILVGFGVGLDMIHSIITSLIAPVWAKATLGTIEDGGEMLTMSVTCWYLMTVVHRNGLVPVPTLLHRARGILSRK